jgi:hypothetical protein
LVPFYPFRMAIWERLAVGNLADALAEQFITECLPRIIAF